MNIFEETISEVTYCNMANFLGIFGDYSRIKILHELSKEELSVTQICNKLNMSKSAVSHQLKTLKDNKVVRRRKDGKNIFYKLDDDHVLDILNTTFEHVMEK